MRQFSNSFSPLCTDPTNIIVKSSIEVVTRKPGEGSKAQWARMRERCKDVFSFILKLFLNCNDTGMYIF